MDVSELPTAIDISSVVGLIAVGIFTAQILLGLLLSVGYNPVRGWPRLRWAKLFTFHNWLGYIGLATAFVHPTILLASSTAKRATSPTARRASSCAAASSAIRFPCWCYGRSGGSWSRRPRCGFYGRRRSSCWCSSV